MSAKRVLLVEDEGLIRFVTAEALRDDGFEVVEAVDGDEAARLLDGPDPFDILITDMRMPGTRDGVAVALHARLRQSAIPVLVVSGFAWQVKTRLQVLDPAAVFLNKPYKLDEVVKVSRQLTFAS